MKILHITDSHGTVKSPNSRKDVYYISFLKKFYELYNVIRKENIDVVIHTGDLFHTSKISDKFAGQIAEIIKLWNIPVYVVPGNHDIEGYSLNTLDQTKLGLFEKTGIVTILDRNNPITLHDDINDIDIAISGQEYYMHIDEGNMEDFQMKQDYGDINILCIHGYIADTKQHPDIKHTLVDDINTDADIILSGHYHRQFEATGHNFEVYNPGSMMRVEQNEYNKNHLPKYGILNIKLDKNNDIEYSYTFHSFVVAQPSIEVFDYNQKYLSKAKEITLDNYKNSLTDAFHISNNNSLDNDKKYLEELNKNIGDDILQLINDLYTSSQSKLDENFNTKQGFITNSYNKNIKSIELHNFQSHSDTKLYFCDGLNILHGESNNGKTSILRALIWVIDNEPLGTDFIQEGKDECYVKLTFNDDSYIIRKRTLKDTGSYITGEPDIDSFIKHDNINYYKTNIDGVYIDTSYSNLNYNINTLYNEYNYSNYRNYSNDGTKIVVNNRIITNEYKGFTNAIPVEIDNIHQMPLVSITKDLSTHLNILTQFENPFLITESPIVKASAIGRITNTHIYDNAIKEANKEIINNSKKIKIYEEQLKGFEDDINKNFSDIPVIEKFNTLYEAIVNKCSELDSFINYMAPRLTKIHNILNSIIEASNNIESCNNVIEFCNKALPINNNILFVNNLNNKYSNILSIKDKINYELDNIDDYNNWIKIKSNIDIIYNLNKYIIELKNKYNNCINCGNTIESNKKVFNINSSVSSKLKLIINYIEENNRIYSNLNPLIDKINILQSNINLETSNIKKYKIEIKNIKKQLKDKKEEQSNFALNNGLCPCCGQEVYDNHKQNIINFMQNI